jgi:hypothetical protein
MAKALLFIVTLAAVTFAAILLVDRVGDAAARDCTLTAMTETGSCG